ncbi:hypothetical protein FQN54_002087 [Arachnomyces sp. PD_36]|nr:hypothetical protein FQN54_002087 [Arachnomyces sp. PD_36]
MKLIHPILAILASGALAQDDVTLTGESTETATTPLNGLPTGPPEVLYPPHSSTIILSTATEEAASTETESGNRTTVTKDSVTLLVGGKGTTTLTGTETSLVGNATSTSTTSTAVPTNTRPCNGYPEFCERKYSNITEVAAHNSPFARTGNAASNQYLPVTTQLNDGIRMLQFQSHYMNDTIYLCHTSCDIINVGTLEDYLKEVTTWLKENPYDVLTIMMGNFDLVSPKNYSAPIEASGLIDYVYTPPKAPMGLDDWPPLSEFILSGKRAVVFLDYMANQTEVPYVLDEFSQMWETPFSPTNRDFPCNVQRPPDLPPQQAKDRLYIANHNLNTAVDLMGTSLLVPNTVVINETNAIEGYGSLGWMGKNCTEDWNRPPNFLLVDFYNVGSSNGSVFEVAANLNNVTYNGKCCGSESAASTLLSGNLLPVAIAAMVALFI